MTEKSFKDIDIALFSAGGGISKQFRQSVVDSGAVMIDNSSAFRMDADVPLVVPEVNPEDVKNHNGVIANPNCSTIIMLVAVAPLHRAKGLKRLVAATYQATSGAGAKGMAELELQTRQVLEGDDINPQAFAHRIAFNLIPHIDAFYDNGYTKEELKMLFETRKMLHLPELMVSCTCVRVPVLRAHSEALNLEFDQEITPAEAVRSSLTLLVLLLLTIRKTTFTRCRLMLQIKITFWLDVSVRIFHAMTNVVWIFSLPVTRY